MKQLVEVPSDNGVILIEVDASDEAITKIAHVQPAKDTLSGLDFGMEQASLVTDAGQKIRNTFEKAMENIKPATQAILNSFQEISPDQVSVEFSVGFKYTAGGILAFIGSTEANTNFKVTMSWKKQ